MTEKWVEELLVRRVKEFGGVAYKFVSPGNAGVPDRLIILPGGEIFFVELKATGKRERALQVQVQEQMRKLGAVVFSSVDSGEKVEEVIRYMRRSCNGV